MAENPAPADGPKPARPRLELIILVGGLIATAQASVMITVPVMPRFITLIGGSTFALGVALAASSLGRFLLNIPAGVAAERIGRKRVIITGSLFVLVFGTLSGTSSSPIWFWGYRFLIGVGSAMAITVANVVAADISSVENRGRVLGLMQGVQLLVGLAAPSLGGYIGQYVNIRAPFYFSGTAAGVFALWSLVRLPETRPAPVAGTSGGVNVLRSLGSASLLRDPSFLAVCLLGFSTFFLRNGGTSGLAPAYLDEVMGVGPGTIGLLFTASSIMFGLLVYPSGWVADRWGRKTVILPAGILVAAGFYILPFMTTIGPFAAMFLALNASVAWGGSAPAAYVGDISPTGQRGVAFGMYRTFGDAAGIVSPIIALGLADALNYKVAFAFGATLWILTLLVFARIAKESTGARRSHPQAIANRTFRPAGES